ncbi:peptidyl-prolyl-cis-trans isomerase [Histoplasma capsulatum H143]|uniref:Peptidyl-prolyl-cis-trans isomerase n=1 Tax=Ajellomyces capsulatus (strain H143) TaxID=544712 RepID=C6HS99_AJECH|nr:peptidyl-prolyl-cis-trans isomerase [Histoplasma capsulatum H143]
MPRTRAGEQVASLLSKALQVRAMAEPEEEARSTASNKRSRSKLEENQVNDESSSSGDDFGPAFPSTVPRKKRRKLPYEKVYINALPVSARYSKSLMHKDQLSFVTLTPLTDFLITSSIDGVVKFWKKMPVGVEFVKEFRAHVGELKGVSVSLDGRNFATVGVDKTVKIFDVITFGVFAGYIGEAHRCRY